MNKKNQSILDLKKHVDQQVRVKFQGGREVIGTLKGYDQLVNLVLDSVKEIIRDPNDPYKLTNKTRDLGLVVCRGTSVMCICPSKGFEEIQNPFMVLNEEQIQME
eukprot:595286_1